MTTLVLLTAALASGAGALLPGPGGRRSVLRASRVEPPKGRRLPQRPLIWVAGIGAVATAAGLGLEGRHLALTAVLTIAALGVARLAERSRDEKRAQRRRQQVVDYCEALVGELGAGQPVTRAVERSVEAWPDAAAVASAARMGASVPAALRRVAQLPGATAVRRLAAAWQVSASTGAGLALAVEQVLVTAREEDAIARLVRSELASARATARLVTALPVVVLVVAQGAGARPWHFLLDTAAGVGCLGAGVALSLLGLRWIDRIADRAVGGWD